jgi:hypothetical protein
LAIGPDAATIAATFKGVEMAGKGVVETVFKVTVLAVAVGLVVAYFVADKESYLTYAFVLVIVSWPIEWMFSRSRKRRAPGDVGAGVRRDPLRQD